MRQYTYTGPFYRNNTRLIKQIPILFNLWKETGDYKNGLREAEQKKLYTYIQYFSNLPEGKSNNYFPAEIGKHFKALLFHTGALLNYPDPTKNGRSICILHNTCTAGCSTSHLLKMIKEYADYAMQENYNDDLPLYTALFSKSDIAVIDALLTHHTVR